MKLTAMIIGMSVLGSQIALAAPAIGPAGCGLGHRVFPRDNQVLASTTNGLSGTQTFGISTGTLDCDADKVTSNAIRFVETNKIALSNEAARGRGETLTALSAILGCSDPVVFSQEVKKSFESVFKANGENSIGIVKSIQSTLEASPVLAKSCVHRS